MPYIDLARKPMTGGPEEAKPMSPPSPSYPGLHLDVPAMPEIKLNTEIECKVKLRLNGVRQDNYSGKKNVCLDFDVMGIDLGAVPKKKNSAAEDLEEVMSKDMAEMDKD